MDTRDMITALMPKYCSFRKMARDISRHSKVSHMFLARRYHGTVEDTPHLDHVAIEKVFKQHFG